MKIVLIGELEAIPKFWHLFAVDTVMEAARSIDAVFAAKRMVAKDRKYRECDRDDKDATYHGFNPAAIISELSGVDDVLFDPELLNLIERQPYLGSVCRINLSSPPSLLLDSASFHKRLIESLTSEIR